LQKRLELFFESICFLTHIASRVVFNKFGPNKRQRINDTIGPMLVEFTLHHFYKPKSSVSQADGAGEFKHLFYDRLNTSEREYSLCKAFVLKVEDDVAYADKVASGLKSKGTVNLFTDNVVNILHENNPITYLRIMQTLISASDPKEIEAVAIKAAGAV